MVTSMTPLCENDVVHCKTCPSSPDVGNTALLRRNVHSFADARPSTSIHFIVSGIRLCRDTRAGNPSATRLPLTRGEVDEKYSGRKSKIYSSPAQELSAWKRARALRAWVGIVDHSGLEELNARLPTLFVLFTLFKPTSSGAPLVCQLTGQRRARRTCHHVFSVLWIQRMMFRGTTKPFTAAPTCAYAAHLRIIATVE